MTTIYSSRRLGLLAFAFCAGCMSTAEKAEREAAIERIKSDAKARIERAEQERAQAEAERDPAFLQWQRENEAYIARLCSSPPGAEHQQAWESFYIAFSSDRERASKAAQEGRRVVPCPEPDSTSAAGYTWSNGWLVLSGFSWSNVSAPEPKETNI